MESVHRQSDDVHASKRFLAQRGLWLSEERMRREVKQQTLDGNYWYHQHMSLQASEVRWKAVYVASWIYRVRSRTDHMI